MIHIEHHNTFVGILDEGRVKEEKGMMPTPTTSSAAAGAPNNSTPTTLVVAHPATLSGADILNIVNGAIDQDAPVVIQAIPSATAQISAYVTLGEIGLGVINQIVQAIHAAHSKGATK